MFCVRTEKTERKKEEDIMKKEKLLRAGGRTGKEGSIVKEVLTDVKI